MNTHRNSPRQMQVRVLTGSPNIRNRCYHNASLSLVTALLKLSQHLAANYTVYRYFRLLVPLSSGLPSPFEQNIISLECVSECRFVNLLGMLFHRPTGKEGSDSERVSRASNILRHRWPRG